MAEIIGVFTTKNRRNSFEKAVTFTIYDDYTYHVDSWISTKRAEFKIVNNNVWVKHEGEKSYIKIERNMDDYIIFIENILMIVGEHNMLTGD